MQLKLNLPKINELESNRNELEEVLISLRDQVEDTYDGKISVVVTPSSTYNNKKEKVLSYALYLVFMGRNSFSYRLMEINCKNADGGLPIEVNAFVGPSKSFGEANTIDELNRKIENVFSDSRTREIILSNYNPDPFKKR